MAHDAKAPSVTDYKKQVAEYMADAFSVKHDTILTMQGPLTRSNGAPSASFLGSALQFAISAAGGPFVDALEVGAAVGTIIKTAIPSFASAVGKSVAGGGSTATGIATGTFVVDYAHAVKEHQAIVAKQLEGSVTSEQSGKEVTEALNGHMVAGKLQLKDAEVGRIQAQTRDETLDAWTLAQQKQGDKKDHNKQGFSDPSTGQLHLDALVLRANGTLEVGGSREARMEGVGNDAAQLDGDRELSTIHVQRTMNVRWDYPGMSGQFGLNLWADNRMAEDEFGADDKAAAAMFHDPSRDLFPVTSDQNKEDAKLAEQNYAKGLHKILNLIVHKTPHQLGFKMKGD